MVQEFLEWERHPTPWKACVRKWKREFLKAELGIAGGGIGDVTAGELKLIHALPVFNLEIVLPNAPHKISIMV